LKAFVKLTCSFEHAPLSKPVLPIEGCPEQDRAGTSNSRHSKDTGYHQQQAFQQQAAILFPLSRTDWAARLNGLVNPLLCTCSSRSGRNIWESILEGTGSREVFLAFVPLHMVDHNHA